MLTNLDIEEIAEKGSLDLIGVFSKDKMPKERVAGSYVINLQDYDDGEGTHWVACKIFNNKKCCYFDAFGIPPPIEVNSFLMPFKPFASNQREIQDFKSQKCGYFCLSFIQFFNDFNTKKGDVYEAYDDFLNSFTNDTKKNDTIVMEMLQKY